MLLTLQFPACFAWDLMEGVKLLILLNMFLSNMRKEREFIVLMFNIFENTWDFYTGLHRCYHSGEEWSIWLLLLVKILYN